MLMEKTDQTLTCFKSNMALFLFFSLLSLAHLVDISLHMPDKSPKMDSKFTEESVLCNFE